jgi:hypothetical protein
MNIQISVTKPPSELGIKKTKIPGAADWRVIYKNAITDLGCRKGSPLGRTITALVE